MGATIKKSKGPVNKGTKNNRNVPNHGYLEIFRVVLIVLISIFMFYPPFLRGLYFEEDQLPAEIFIFIIFMVFCVYKFIKKDKRFLETPVDYAALGLVAVYLISVVLYIVGIGVAVAPRLAVLEWLKYCMYFSVFSMLSELITTLKTKLAVLWVIISTTICLSLLSFDGAAGSHIINVLNDFFKNRGSSLNFFGVFVSNRIYSTLQYPNAFAAYLLAVLIITIALIILSNKLWVKAVGGACSFILLITLIFTQSRGVFIIAPIIAIIFILAMPKEMRIKCISTGLAVLISAGLITLKLYGYMMAPEGKGLQIWLFLLLGVVLSAGFTILFDFLNKWFEKVNWKVYVFGLVALIVIVAIVSLVALNTPEKLVLSHTVSQQDSPVTVQKSTTLKPGIDYKLVYDVDARIDGDKPGAYTIYINYKREKDIVVNDKEVGLTSYEGKKTNGVETKEVPFKLPSDSKIVELYFRNTYQGTSATFYNAKIVDAGTGNTVKNLILKHKYIPESITDKFSNMFESRSYVERTIYYRDGFKMLKDRWLLGAGGGAWTSLNFYYQSFLYWSTQAHNYLIQIAVECGVIGIIALIFLILSIVSIFITEYKYRRNTDQRDRVLQAAIFAGIAALIVHSFFDFDFSLSAVFLLLWQLLGIFNSRYRNSVVEETVEYGKPFVPKMLNVLTGFVNIKRIKVPVAAILTASVVLLFVPVFIVTAKGYAKVAVKQSGQDNEAAINYMAKAAQTDPFMPQYKMDYVKLLLNKQNKTSQDIDEIKKQLKSAEKLCWYNTDLIPQVGSYYINISEIDKGLSLFDRAVELRPLRPEEWQQKAGAYYSVAEYYIGKGQNDKAAGYIDKLINMQNEAIIANKNNMNPFTFDVKTDEKLERLLYAKEIGAKVIKSDIEKLVFYNIPDMDINFDGIPDQWTAGNNASININSGNKTVTVDNKDGAKDSYIQSRQINLTESKIYKIEVELLNKPDSGALPFIIAGVNQQNESLTYNGSSYTAEFTTPKGFKPSDNFLRIFVSGKYEIKGVRITEV